MEQNPSCETNSHSASQEILHSLWNPKFHYRVHNSPLLVLILSQMDPIRIFPPYFSKIFSNIIQYHPVQRLFISQAIYSP